MLEKGSDQVRCEQDKGQKGNKDTVRPKRLSALEKIKGKEDRAEGRWRELLLY